MASTGRQRSLLSFLVPTAWFCGKRLQNDGALNFVWFFSWPLCMCIFWYPNVFHSCRCRLFKIAASPPFLPILSFISTFFPCFPVSPNPSSPIVNVTKSTELRAIQCMIQPVWRFELCFVGLNTSLITHNVCSYISTSCTDFWPRGQRPTKSAPTLRPQLVCRLTSNFLSFYYLCLTRKLWSINRLSFHQFLTTLSVVTLLTNRKAERNIILVCRMITFQSLDVGSSYLHIWSSGISPWNTGPFLYKGHRVKHKVTGSKKVEKSKIVISVM